MGRRGRRGNVLNGGSCHSGALGSHQGSGRAQVREVGWSDNRCADWSVARDADWSVAGSQGCGSVTTTWTTANGEFARETHTPFGAATRNTTWRVISCAWNIALVARNTSNALWAATVRIWARHVSCYFTTTGGATGGVIGVIRGGVIGIISSAETAHLFAITHNA